MDVKNDIVGPDAKLLSLAMAKNGATQREVVPKITTMLNVLEVENIYVKVIGNVLDHAQSSKIRSTNGMRFAN